MGRTNLGVLEKLLAAGGAGDWDTVTGCVSGDFTITEPDPLPYGGTHHGPAGFRQMIELYQQTWTDPQFAIQVMGEIGDTVVMKGVLSARSTATGRSVEAPVAEFFSVGGGLIVTSQVFYFDLAAVVAAVTVEGR